MKPISVLNAEISTVAVQIETVTVSGKQMTLSMFRQLRDEPLISDAGEFRGNPWGTVNYHPGKDCPQHRKHLHVVWQLGCELRRAIVSETILDEDLPSLSKQAYSDSKGVTWPVVSRYVQAVYCANGHHYPRELTVMRGIAGGNAVVFTFDGVNFRSPLDQVEAHHARSLRPPGHTTVDYNYRPPECKAVPTAASATDSLRPAAARIREEFAAHHAAETKRLSKHVRRWDELNALPQLFIAV